MMTIVASRSNVHPLTLRDSSKAKSITYRQPAGIIPDSRLLRRKRRTMKRIMVFLGLTAITTAYPTNDAQERDPTNTNRLRRYVYNNDNEGPGINEHFNHEHHTHETREGDVGVIKNIDGYNTREKDDCTHGRCHGRSVYRSDSSRHSEDEEHRTHTENKSTSSDQSDRCNNICSHSSRHEHDRAHSHDRGYDSSGASEESAPSHETDISDHTKRRQEHHRRQEHCKHNEFRGQVNVNNEKVDPAQPRNDCSHNQGRYVHRNDHQGHADAVTQGGLTGQHQGTSYDQGRDLYRQAMNNFQGQNQLSGNYDQRRGGYKEHGY